MYIGLYLEYQFFLSDFSEILTYDMIYLTAIW